MKINSISASRAKTYDTCSFKYLMTYHLYKCEECGETFYDKEMNDKSCPYCKYAKVSKISMKTNWGAVHGTALHWVLEQYVNALRGHLQDGTKMSQKDIRYYLNWRDRVADIYKVNPPFQENITFELLALAKTKEYNDIVKDCKNCPLFKAKKCSITAKAPEEMPGCPKNLYEESLMLVEKMLRDLDDVFKNAKILGTEQSFEIILNDSSGVERKINGIIDLVAQTDKDTIELYDYKFGNHAQSYDEVATDIQAKLYSIAAKKLYPGYTNYILNFQYVKAQPIVISFSDKEDEETINFILTKCQEIAAEQQKIERISNKPETFWKCKYLCDSALCNIEWGKFVKKFKNT